MAVLALAPKGGTIVCNGYKDREFIRLALMGQKLGHNVFIVIEKESEVGLVIEEAAALKVKPQVGLRVRLRSEAHTSELQSLMRIPYAVFCLMQKNTY